MTSGKLEKVERLARRLERYRGPEFELLEEARQLVLAVRAKAEEVALLERTQSELKKKLSFSEEMVQFLLLRSTRSSPQKQR